MLYLAVEISSGYICIIVYEHTHTRTLNPSLTTPGDVLRFFSLSCSLHKNILGICDNSKWRHRRHVSNNRHLVSTRYTVTPKLTIIHAHSHTHLHTQTTHTHTHTHMHHDLYPNTTGAAQGSCTYISLQTCSTLLIQKRIAVFRVALQIRISMCNPNKKLGKLGSCVEADLQGQCLHMDWLGACVRLDPLWRAAQRDHDVQGLNRLVQMRTLKKAEILASRKQIPPCRSYLDGKALYRARMWKEHPALLVDMRHRHYQPVVERTTVMFKSVWCTHWGGSRANFLVLVC